MDRFSRRLSSLLLLASASLFYLPLGVRALWDSDEGRYAEIAREMLELKDWITPHLNYVVYLEKPPLVYWLTALSMSIFGVNAVAARFWSAAFGVLTVGLTYLIGKHWKSERCGLLAGSILATSLLFFVLTQYLVLDMALTFWMTLSLYAASRWIQERTPERLRRYAMLFALASAGGLLTKGPVAIVLPGGVLALTVLFGRLGNQLRRTPWQGPLSLCALLSAPWFVAVSLQRPYFFSFFFIHEHVSRFLTTVHHRSAPFYFFIPVLVGGFLPWSVFLPGVARYWLARRGTALKRDAVGALLVFWVVFIFSFFSLSQSKLPAYLLPIFPALALLVAQRFEEDFEAETLPPWLRGGVVALIGLFIVALMLLKRPQTIPDLLAPPASLILAQSGFIGLVLGFGVFIFVGIWGMRRSAACFGGVLLVHVFLWTLLASMASGIDPYYSAESIGLWLRANAAPDQKVISYGVSYENRLQTLGFYARRRVAIYGDPGEFSLGQAHDPDSAGWFASEPEADAAIGRVAPGSWVVTDDEHWRRLHDLGLQPNFHPVIHSGRLWLAQRV